MAPTLEVVLMSPTVLAPGDHVKGFVVVDVPQKTFSLTGIYVELIGAEYSYVIVGDDDYSKEGFKNSYGNFTDFFGIHQDYTVKAFKHSLQWTGGNGRHYSFQFKHVDQHRTLYGNAKSSGASGGAMLEPGHYEFPFDFLLPYAAPPSYAFSISYGGSSVCYNLRAVLSVPHNGSIRQKIPLLVLPVAPFSQVQYTQSHTLTSPCVYLPVKKTCGLFHSSSGSVNVSLQCCPSVVVVGDAMADEYYNQRRQMEEGQGTVVMGRSSSMKGSSESDGDFSSTQGGKRGKYTTKENEKDALTGKVVCWHDQSYDLQSGFTPSTTAPGVLCARVIIENNTKKKIKSFHIALRQVRMVNIRTFVRSDRATLSQATVQLPSNQPCKPGERIAIDVELPMHRELVLHDDSLHFWDTSRAKLRRKPCPTVATPAFKCETFIEVTSPDISLKTDVDAFSGCVQLTDLVGEAGAPNVPLPVAYSTSFTSEE